MESFPCLNVRSDECAVAKVCGMRVIRYQGEEYSVIGLYFGNSPSGRRELRYVLRPIQERDRRLAVSADGRR